MANAGVLGLWAGALGLSAATAAIAFPEMKSLEPQLGAYSAYDGEHWVLAAGHVAAGVFGISRLVELGCLGLASVLLVAIALRGRMGRSAMAPRLALLLALVALMGYRVGVLGARMDATLDEYWASAEAGDTETAAAARARFDADHGTATTTMAATLVLVLGSLGGGIAFPANSKPTGGGQ